MRFQRGLCLAEMLVVLVLGLVGMTFAMPSLAHLRDGGRAAAGARCMVSTFRALRSKSVTLRRARGLLFEQTSDGWIWWEVEDGNGNDLRVAEVRSGVDPIRSGPHRLGELVEHAALGFPPTPAIPRLPPRTGVIDERDGPIQFGKSDLVSFTPLGSASSGTLYVTDGRMGLHAVVLYGPTAKIRVWRYDAGRRRWAI